MLSGVFYWILNMSIVATITGVIVLLLRRIPFIPRRFLYVLWLVPMLRFWIPFGMGYKYSILSLLNKAFLRTIVIYSGESQLGISLTNAVGAADSYFPIAYKTVSLSHVFSAASVVWSVVAAAAVLTTVMLYGITKSEIGAVRHLRDNVYVSEALRSPGVFGIFRPRIILPEYLEHENPEFILLHEQTHCKRGDNFWRFAAVLTCCLHWFNPFVWLFLKRFLEDMELACDEMVLRRCGEEKKKEYAKALLACEEKKTIFASAFGGANIRVRMERILTYKRLTVFSTICFILFLAAVAITLLTNAVN